MTNDVIYKVLWVDDQTLENGETTSFYIGFQGIADNYNIELVPFDNWEEAEHSLRKDFDEYSAVILDANCKSTGTIPSKRSLLRLCCRLLPTCSARNAGCCLGIFSRLAQCQTLEML